MAVNEWSKYTNTGSALDYTKRMNSDENDAYTKVTNAALDYQQQNVPRVIKSEMTFADYVKGLENTEPDSVIKHLQKYVDLAAGK